MSLEVVLVLYGILLCLYSEHRSRTRECSSSRCPFDRPDYADGAAVWWRLSRSSELLGTKKRD